MAQQQPVFSMSQSSVGIPPASQSSMSVIGSDLTILGQKITIVTQGTLQVDGDVRGDIHGRLVIIGPGGKVTGTIAAESVEVRGGVNGAIRSRDVTLHPSAHVEGDILQQSLSISEGAHFDGRVRRPKDPSDLNLVLDPGALVAAGAAPDPSGQR